MQVGKYIDRYSNGPNVPAPDGAMTTGLWHHDNRQGTTGVRADRLSPATTCRPAMSHGKSELLNPGLLHVNPVINISQATTRSLAKLYIQFEIHFVASDPTLHILLPAWLAGSEVYLVILCSCVTAINRISFNYAEVMFNFKIM